MKPPTRRRILLAAIAAVLLAAAGVGLSVAYARTARQRYAAVDPKALASVPLHERSGSDEDIPVKFRRLDGRRVCVVGEMYDPYGGNTTAEFQLVYNFSELSSRRHGPPKVQERVFATAPPGRPVPYHGVPVEVRGVLHVGVEKKDGLVVSVYRLDVHDVRPMGAPGEPDPLAVLFDNPMRLACTALFLLMLIVPVSYATLRAVRDHRDRARDRPGVCRGCGYDLRGNPAAGRCPECGRPTGQA